MQLYNFVLEGDFNLAVWLFNEDTVKLNHQGHPQTASSKSHLPKIEIECTLSDKDVNPQLLTGE